MSDVNVTADLHVNAAAVTDANPMPAEDLAAIAQLQVAVAHLADILVELRGTLDVAGPLTDTQLRATSVGVSGPLTDAQLRAAAVPVSGPLTDAQLRAARVPVDVEHDQPLTDVQLRAAAVPVSGPLTDAQLRAGSLAVTETNPLDVSGLATEATLAANTAPVTLTSRMFARQPRTGYRLWPDNQPGYLILAEAPAGSLETALVWDGIRVPKPFTGEVIERTGFAWADRAVGW